MEPIIPELAWQPCCYGDALPHAQFLYAIIAQAWKDANSRFNTEIRTKARFWFYSYQFYEFCALLKIDNEIFLDVIETKWGKL